MAQREDYTPHALLQPVTEELPQGTDPRLDISPSSPYFQLRDARSDARAAERRGEYDPAESAAALQHWVAVRNFSTKILRSVGKDIEVSSWLIEALIRLDGLNGLADGIDVALGLFTDYWPDFFPGNDEDGPEARFAALTGLNGVSSDGSLMQALRKTPLFARADGTPFLLWQYEQSEEVQGIGDTARRKQRLASGILPFSEVEDEAARLGQTTLSEVYHGSRRALKSWKMLDKLMTERLGHDSPPTSRIMALLIKAEKIAARYITLPVVQEAILTEQELKQEESIAITTGRETSSECLSEAQYMTNPKEPTRDDMLNHLIYVAQYFEKKEPQSPISGTLYEVVRRARLSWRELLVDLIEDGSTRAAILSKLGITPASSDEK